MVKKMSKYMKVMKQTGYLNGFKSVNICPECGKKHMSYHKGNAFCSNECANKNTDKFIEELKEMGLVPSK